MYCTGEHYLTLQVLSLFWTDLFTPSEFQMLMSHRGGKNLFDNFTMVLSTLVLGHFSSTIGIKVPSHPIYYF
jgi:hypothetical protein